MLISFYRELSEFLKHLLRIHEPNNHSLTFDREDYYVAIVVSFVVCSAAGVGTGVLSL